MKTNFTRTCLLSLFIVLSTLNTFATEGNGVIKGKVSTSDSRSAAGVSIEIKGSSKGALTDNDGNFIIRNLNPGTYELTISLIGYQTIEETVTVTQNQTSTINIQLQLTQKELEQVIIVAGSQSYKANNTSSSLRIQTPLLEMPQNIQVVTGKAIQDQQVISMSDGLVRNVSGLVRMEHWGDMYTNISARGSQIQAFRNGFNMVNSFWGPLTEDMSFVDHIEFVKGPAGFMLANGDPSGLYNVVTKKPTGQSKGEVSLTMGSWDLYRATLDLDGSLGKNGKLLYRLNLAGQQKKSFRPNEYNDRYVVAPVISYQVDDKTKLTLEYVWQNAKMSDVGSYYVFAADGYATLPRDFTMNPVGMPGTTINDHTLTASLVHSLNDNWKLTTQMTRNSYRMRGTSSWPGVVAPDGKVIRTVGSWDADADLTLGQAFVNGDVQTGAIHHRILGGMDMGNKAYAADWGQSHNLDSIGAEFDIYAPYLGAPVNGYPHFDHSTPVAERAAAAGGIIDQRYTGIYLQDELGFFDNKVRLTLAGRYTTVTQSEWGGAPMKAKHFTPRVGVSVSLDKLTSVYGMYDQAFIPQGGILVNGGSVQPITGNNIEFGIKKDWAGGNWNTTLAVYRIIKNNELTPDPWNPNSGKSIELGQKQSEGVEFDLRGRIARGLTLTANYAYTDSKITRVADGVTIYKVGDLVPGFSKHTANAWLNYKLSTGVLKGIGASAGFTYLLDRATYWDPTPTGGAVLPDYFKLDAGLFWERDKIKITANVFNVLDEYLYSGSWYAYLNAYYWQTDAPRNVRLSIAYRF